MTAHVIAAIWWIFGTFGLIGLIAAWWFFPLAVDRIVAGVMKLFAMILGYRLGCAIVAAIIAGLAVDYARHAYDDAQFEQASAAFKQAQAERDTRIAKETREEVWKDIADATAANTVADKEETDFETKLPAVPNAGPNPFRVGADAPSLRSIFGQPVGGPVRSKGVPKALRKGLPAAHH